MGEASAGGSRPAKRPPRHPRSGRLLTALVCGSLLTVGASGADDAVDRRRPETRVSESPADVLRRIEAEAREDDRDALREIARDLDSGGDNPERAYARALVAYRLAVALDLERDRAEVVSELATARELLERRLELAPEDPEVGALLVAVLGRQIALRPVLGVFLGRRANALLATFVATHPEHPRLTLQQGILAFFTPASLGGGPRASEALLRRALDLLAREDPGAGPGWGRMDALIWLARSLDEQGRLDEARLVYERALRLAPKLPLLHDELAALR